MPQYNEKEEEEKDGTYTSREAYKSKRLVPVYLNMMMMYLNLKKSLLTEETCNEIVKINIKTRSYLNKRTQKTGPEISQVLRYCLKRHGKQNTKNTNKNMWYTNIYAGSKILSKCMSTPLPESCKVTFGDGTKKSVHQCTSNLNVISLYKCMK